MPPLDEPTKERCLQDVVDDIGLYPVEAYEFLQRGLSYTVNKVHGSVEEPSATHHVSGQQLCEGLREFALTQWGLLAGTVLRRWNITSTLDFGRIVFAMVDNGLMHKTDDDTIEDFRNIFDFKSSFERNYKIECKS